jgi:hypothetical protein
VRDKIIMHKTTGGLIHEDADDTVAQFPHYIELGLVHRNCLLRTAVLM